MALSNCKECKKEVSTKADRCPHCGIKNPTTKASEVFVGALFLVAIVFGVSKCTGSDPKPEDKARAAETQATDKAAAEQKEAECKSNLQCWGDRATVGAGVYCRDAVERLAKYSSKWTDGTFDSKFTHFRWLNKEKGTLTMIGDKIQFQNGFGAYQNHIYYCDYDPSSNKVQGARAEPGRL